jgi:nitrogen regulatory protein P-II 1
MKEVIAVLRPERWAETVRRLESLPLGESSQHRVLGCGSEGGLRYLPRQGAVSGAGIRCLPRRLACWTVEEEMVAPLVQALLEANCSGRPGDGKIYVLPVAECYAIEEAEPLAMAAVPLPETAHAARQ